eukprot:m51a1_g366 hypothetical protein (136) ;mRNA; r:604218-604876
MLEADAAIAEDLETAVQLYRVAAERGLALAQFLLALCYSKGRGKAADHGFAPAMVNLGYCYIRGEGVQCSAEKALALWKAAADGGCVLGFSNLAEYLSVPGPTQDMRAASAMWSAASSLGDDESECRLATLHSSN